MPIEAGDYIKAVFADETSGEREWMWVRVERADEQQKVVFGVLDSEPLVHQDLHLGMKLAVSYDNIREHMKAAAFDQ